MGPGPGRAEAYRARRDRRRFRTRLGRALLPLFLLLVGGLVLASVASRVSQAVDRGLTSLAAGSPILWRVPALAALVERDLGAALSEPVSADRAQVPFTVARGEATAAIAARLAAAGLVRDARAIVYLAEKRGLSGSLQAGSYLIRPSMTPDQVVTTLLLARDTSITIRLRPSLRIEQIAALLRTLPLDFAARAFLDAARSASPALIASHPWLGLSVGASLEGYLAAGDYRILPDTSPNELLGLMLDRTAAAWGPSRLAALAADERGAPAVVALASLVEREAARDDELARIAGVYVERLAAGMALDADPTVIYGADSLALRNLPFDSWPTYKFWFYPATPIARVKLTDDLAAFQTYLVAGLPDSPICSPGAASLDAALNPDRSRHELYFVAIPHGGGRHDFSQTLAEHQRKLRAYGYRG